MSKQVGSIKTRKLTKDITAHYAIFKLSWGRYMAWVSVDTPTEVITQEVTRFGYWNAVDAAEWVIFGIMVGEYAE